MNEEAKSEEIIKRPRGTGQKISWFIAMFCYLMSFASIAFTLYWKMNNGTQSPIFASGLASIFFFVSCGFVLQFIANSNIPDYNLSKKS